MNTHLRGGKGVGVFRGPKRGSGVERSEGESERQAAEPGWGPGDRLPVPTVGLRSDHPTAPSC